MLQAAEQPDTPTKLAIALRRADCGRLMDAAAPYFLFNET
jgi:hypothetical protein